MYLGRVGFLKGGAGQVGDGFLKEDGLDKMLMMR